MYTDIHCHLLPGVDDGCETWEDSRACLQMAQKEGITRLLVTPHIRPGKYPNTPEALRAAFSQWEARASEFGIQLALGCEAYFHHELAAEWKAGHLVGLGKEARYLLVELPVAGRPHGITDVFYNLRLAGVMPVLAHPERYVWAQRSPRRLADFFEAGIPFQVTTHSLVGTFGAEIEKTAWAILDSGWASFVASDSHRPTARPPLFREAVRRIARRYGKTAARRLCVENPRRIFEGLSVEPVSCVARKRGFFFGRP